MNQIMSDSLKELIVKDTFTKGIRSAKHIIVEQHNTSTAFNWYYSPADQEALYGKYNCVAIWKDKALRNENNLQS